MAKSLKEEFTKGIIKENPVLRLMLGTCATLAVTTAASNAIGMGLATTFVLVCSNAVISLLKKIIPDKVRIPAYITIVAGFVTIVQLLIKAYVPALNKSLGVFLPLIVVNCIILGRAEMFASKNPVLPSIVDGLGMGVGFTAALLAMGIIRELLGAGTVFGIPILSNFMDPIIIFLLPPGGFFVFGILIAIAGKLSAEGKAPETMGCAACPLAASCSKVQEKCDKFLGICPFLGVSKKLNTAFGMSCAVTVVMVIATAVTWPVYTYVLVPLNLDYLQTVVFILIIAALVQLLETVMHKYMPPLYNALGIYLPLITTNCAVLGVTMLVLEKGAENPSFGYLASLVNAFGAGIGFMVAMVIFAGVRERLELCDVPNFLKGLPITLIAASLVAVSFLGFNGIIDRLLA